MLTDDCQCGHARARHFTGWNVAKPAACMCAECECRKYVAADLPANKEQKK